jgi:CO/xanthine dehydrogenase FAD-binding subunit
MLAEVHLPKLSPSTVGAFEEVTRRKGDFALVGAAILGQWDSSGQIQNCRIVCSGVAPVPLRLRFAEDIVNGTDLSDQVLVKVQQSVMESLDPTEDIHTSSEYRKIVTGVVVRRGLSRLVEQRGVANVSK